MAHFEEVWKLDPYHVVEANVVLEGERSGEAGGDGEVGACNDLEELEGVLRLLLFLFEERLGLWHGNVSFSWVAMGELAVAPSRCK